MPWLLRLLGGRGEQRRRRLPIGRACAENPLIGVVGCGHRPAESGEKAARYRLAPCAHCGVFATPNCGCILFGAHGCGKARDSHPIPTCPDPKKNFFRAENRFQCKQVLSLGRARQQLLIFIFITLSISYLKNRKISRNGRFPESSPESLSNSKTAQNRPPQVRDSRRFLKPRGAKIRPIRSPKTEKNPRSFCGTILTKKARRLRQSGKVRRTLKAVRRPRRHSELRVQYSGFSPHSFGAHRLIPPDSKSINKKRPAERRRSLKN